MENIINKLEQLSQYIQATDDESVMSKLDSALDNISTYDYFGTEGQLDPRGDQRDAEFIPYDPDDEDSDGEYEYFRVESIPMAVQCIKDLIKMLKEDMSEGRDSSEMIENSFQDLFNEYGLNS